MTLIRDPKQLGLLRQRLQLIGAWLRYEWDKAMRKRPW